VAFYGSGQVTTSVLDNNQRFAFSPGGMLTRLVVIGESKFFQQHFAVLKRFLTYANVN